ncbi:MAG TPA: sugar transferase [Hungateiclostridium thermocellum]|jgi:undecaprenyl phosphate N,N'-diacetylbacillosamine 1-phosphate transferase|uniref:Undecaprenyl-phosphate galactose phosphotransferase n=2 Tax=Acetivibrio thermocellus TaxID=1515 RepID=A3DHW7_ACET2|nr:sugar transferase [Acetivibrio thermocellus]CDG36867.1 putative sugar transferase EpsL [Acetivibrio thermocellus BC1]ABN53546.1 Undecaprenyl-phosphate galactose phosphotransferase [Acetivibrio thermocellus ATCC 27405]ADU75985.1 Undecaprenyl-phosphate galactose phosphotransferase [Acetivibrio thermocellus DSM 1313]ALX10020.1 Undecaprenyl-phosphate galactose phosphotransferase [Acetivibrio thermocellus AD2]ANV77794.1 Undecaprenyl-phosphate galactose phosphotransferase [Acetivibrio thermocellu
MQCEVKQKIKPDIRVTGNEGIYKKYLKRPMDFVLSLIAIILLSPLILIIALMVRINLGSPVIFKQERPGLNEKIFTLYKFRTMTDKRDEKGNLLPDSCRLTKFGKFLRSTSLDELPELFNILKGDMSIVGPRPLLVEYLPYYTEEERLRHTVRPGLTGLAQVNGRNNLKWDIRLGLDVEYVKNITFCLDASIIARTIIKVFKREGVAIVDQTPLKDLHVERSNKYDNKNLTI